MRIIREPAPAKINLTLDVLSKRSDGYHELESIMQSVSLADEVVLEIGTQKPWELLCDRNDIPCDRRNLAWKAAEIFCQELSWDPMGLSIIIHKRIPMEAGLGGGSSDAAAVLRALNRCVPNPLSITELADMGGKVGSDVPFCVLGGTAFCQGRGERLTPINCTSKFTYLLCKPPLAFSTPKLFAKLDASEIHSRPEHRLMIDALSRNDPVAAGKHLCNVFEAAVLEDYSLIGQIKSILTANGATGAQMTGSGSVVIGVFATENDANTALAAMKEQFPETYLCKTV
jgi:4-diphosphocytidyl-2-C-methyl-D-erythritol kinase